ncbi:hypothetical protein OHD62_09710 [Mesorhizobium sp. YC-39]|uniref:hypothetical protein n=1 Tax=unclassified Mesorhizobium TaxID=325217 RepID=UPI0021E70D7C|nr:MULTISPECIES: hypothetical protein [unclassified Mesorhizobium]MCV3206917.1 hypothetical protein [Mesorhizobium sp. YC-2]MCV3228643.1 hypothetical protein [Mesorhizobium sp. YC-39]
MSTNLVRQKIAEFLKSSDPSVLCIRGNWGTGKTYTWDDELKKAAKVKDGIALEKYAYVSLFGLNSIDEVQRQIATQTIKRERIGQPFDSSNLSAAFEDGLTLAKKTAGKFSGLFGDGYYAAGAALMTMLIRNRLVCIDDLERKGEHLRSEDILGLISQLKEERDCKVALLLNDERLDDRPQFERFLEKVVDLNLRFIPSASESAATALDNLKATPIPTDDVREQTILLGIDNIRVIRKIYSIVSDIAPMLKDYKPGVLKAVTKSLVLFGWCNYQPEMAPTLNFLKAIGEYPFATQPPNEEVAGLREKWEPKLRQYGYTHTDDFDLVLMDGIINGYFDPKVVAVYATELNKIEQSAEANAKLEKAWDSYRNSFDDNGEELVAELMECFEANAQFYSLGTTSQLIDLFGRIGHQEEANKVFDLYEKAHDGDVSAFDVERLFRFGMELPKDILARVTKAREGVKPDLSNDALFLGLKEAGFDSDIAAQLAKLPVEEYVRVLTSHRGDELRKIREGLTDYLNVSNPTNIAIEIMYRAADALQVIAARSPLDSARAHTWQLIQWQKKFGRLPDAELSVIPEATGAQEEATPAA